jgi:hypothetical protein
VRRRRRSRSRFGGAGPQLNPIFIAGGAAVLVVAAFIFFMVRADQLAPQPQEMRIELPDAFK